MKVKRCGAFRFLIIILIVFGWLPATTAQIYMSTFLGCRRGQVHGLILVGMLVVILLIAPVWPLF